MTASFVLDPRPNPLLAFSGEGDWFNANRAIDVLFCNSVSRYSSNIAVQQDNVSLSYADLDDRVKHFSEKIKQSCHESPINQPVVIYARRSSALIVAILACVRAGRTFAVIDSAYPLERVQAQAGVLSPCLIIGADVTDAAVQHAFGGFANLPVCIIDKQRLMVSVGDVSGESAAPNSNAYLLFTSGTTGTPKCIQTGHAPLLHFLEFYHQRFQPSEHDRFSMLSGLGHDPLLRDIFVPLSVGACVCVPDEQVIRVPNELYSWFERNGITFAHATPQLIRLLTAGSNHLPPLTQLKYVFSGGDMLLRDHVDSLYAVAPNVTVVNFYGSSETPQAMGYYVVEKSDDELRIPLGFGISDVQLLILTEDMQLAPVGEMGQIGIRTRFLSKGYMGDSKATGDKYIASPFTGDDLDQIYLTGDFGFYRQDGAVVGTGRQDDQIKIRGYRVELGDVSSAIVSTGLVANSALLAHSARNGEIQLVAFIVPNLSASSRVGKSGFIQSVRHALRDKLPSYMVPARFIEMSSIPLSPNGKVDRKALEEVLSATKQSQADSIRNDPDLDDRIREIVKAIEDLLEVKIDSLDQTFVDLGGDSLSYVRISSVIEKNIGTLPKGWGARPLSEFELLLPADDSTIKPSPWSYIDVSILLRTLSIMFVVMTHMALVGVPAATPTLFVVSGLNFYRFLAPGLRRSGEMWPTYRFILRFAIPAGIWQLLRSIFILKEIWIPNIFLMGTFFESPDHPCYTFWYLDVLAANIILLAAFFKALHWLSHKRYNAKSVISDHFYTGAVLTLVGIIAAIPQYYFDWWNGRVGYSSVGPMKWFWLLALGVAIGAADTRIKKAILSALALAIGVGSLFLIDRIPYFDEMANYFLVASILMLIWIPEIPFPRILKQPVVVIASSTLFIYILNYAIISRVLPALGVPQNQLLVQLVVSILAGVAATRMWSWGTLKLSMLAKKLMDNVTWNLSKQ